MLATWRIHQRASCLAVSVVTPARVMTAATVPYTSTSFTVNSIIVNKAASVLYQYDKSDIILKTVLYVCNITEITEENRVHNT